MPPAIASLFTLISNEPRRRRWFPHATLLSSLAFDAMPGVEGTQMGVNYGFERVRFLSAVKSGARIRGKFRLIGITERAVSVQTAWDSLVEVEGMIKPAITAHWITLALLDHKQPPL